MNAKPRILFVINSLAGGGAERVLLSLLESSEEIRSEVEFSLALLDHEESRYEAPEWLQVHRLDSRFSLPRSILNLKRLAVRVQPSMLVSFLTRSNISSLVVAKLLGLKSVLSERANTSAHLQSGIKGHIGRELIRLAYPRADRVISVSQGVADDLVRNFRVPPQKVVTIYNPVATEMIQRRSLGDVANEADKPFAVVMSRLVRGKNVALAIEALARSGSTISLLILGDGPERRGLEARVVQLGLRDKVKFLGFVANPFPILKHAEFFISASNGEGFPNAIVEALALGIPVLATNCASGPAEILAGKRQDEVSGLTVTEGGILVPVNDVECMAEGIRLIKSSQSSFSAAGPAIARRFNPDAACAQYWSVFRGVLGSPRCQGGVGDGVASMSHIGRGG